MVAADPRGRCPVCGLSSALRKDGTTGRHPARPGPGLPAVYCDGTGQPPARAGTTGKGGR